MKFLLLLLVILLVEGVEAVSKCQKCSLTYTQSINKDAGDTDCKNNPTRSKFSTSCGAAPSGDEWYCGIAHYQSNTGSYLWERDCVKKSDCKANKKFSHALDSVNVQAEWKCCHDLDLCNHGERTRTNAATLFSMSFISLIGLYFRYC